MDYKKICKDLIAEVRLLRAEVSNLEEMLEYSDAAMARLQESCGRQYYYMERRWSERFYRDCE
jgi:hypothetical protein